MPQRLFEFHSNTAEEAKQYLCKIVSRLKTKAEAEKAHGSAENASYLNRIICETEEKINEM